MNFQVKKNGELTKTYIVNSESEEKAREVWERFHKDEVIELIEDKVVTYPSMFQNCIMGNS